MAEEGEHMEHRYHGMMVLSDDHETRAIFTMQDPRVERESRYRSAWAMARRDPYIRGYALGPDDGQIQIPVASAEAHVPGIEDGPMWEGLRPYQARAVADASRWRHGIIVAPPGSGKTVIGMALALRLRLRPLVLVGAKDLVAQWQSAAELVGAGKLGVVGSGKWQDAQPAGTVALLQTLTRASAAELRKLGEEHGCVLVDECHHAPAETVYWLLAELGGPNQRYGLTATPKRTDGLTQIMHWALGPTRATVRQAALVDAGVSVVPTVVQVPSDFEFELEYDLDKRGESTPVPRSMQAMYRALTEDAGRAALVCRIVARMRASSRSVLVLCGRVDFAAQMARRIEAVTGEACLPLHARLPARVRRERIEALRSGMLRCVTATTLADEGLDVPCLSGLVLAWPARSEPRTIQRVGRIMRAMEGKGAPVVVDVVDGSVAMLQMQAYARARACRKAGYRMAGGGTWETIC
jgi:superfamily II DNA or RNA helicase